MANLFFLPYRPVYDSAGLVAPGAQVYFTNAAGTKKPIYSNSGLTIQRTNPVVADGVGKLPTGIYLDPAITYRVRVYGKTAVAGVDTPIEDYNPYVPGVFADAAALQPVADAAAASAAAASDSAEAAATSETNADTSAAAAEATLNALIAAAAGASIGVYAIPTFTPETYGAVGDGVTDDGAALAAMSAAVSAAGRGVVNFYPGRTYAFGGQTLNKVTSNGTYRFGPNTEFPILISGCSGHVVINGNGAKIKCIAGKKYGLFNADGTAAADFSSSAGLSSPYFAMIRVVNCTGPVEISNIELDGNLLNHSLGGQYGDTGYQIPCSGLDLKNNSGGIELRNIISHHHALDGGANNGPATSGTSPNERGVMKGCHFYCNGRQGVSHVGGNGWSFYDCSFNWTGKAAKDDDTTGPIHSNPGAGFDLEPEGGKYAYNLAFHNCEFVGNYGMGFICDLPNGTSRNVTFDLCRFTGTSNYSAWLKTQGLVARDCKFVGTAVNFWGTTATNARNLSGKAVRCEFSTVAADSPTGNIFLVNRIPAEASGDDVLFDKCRFVAGAAGIAAMGNLSPPYPTFRNCEFNPLSGATLSVSGLFEGTRTLFRETGTGSVGLLPWGIGATLIVGKTTCGPSYDSWAYENSAGTRTVYPASARRLSGKAALYGSATWDPANVTNGSSATTTVTVTGAVVGDRVLTPTFSNDLQGMVLSGHISAANTATVVLTNNTGGALNLASGTLKVEVHQV